MCGICCNCVGRSGSWSVGFHFKSKSLFGTSELFLWQPYLVNKLISTRWSLIVRPFLSHRMLKLTSRTVRSWPVYMAHRYIVCQAVRTLVWVKFKSYFFVLSLVRLVHFVDTVDTTTMYLCHVNAIFLFFFPLIPVLLLQACHGHCWSTVVPGLHCRHVKPACRYRPHLPSVLQSPLLTQQLFAGISLSMQDTHINHTKCCQCPPVLLWVRMDLLRRPSARVRVRVRAPVLARVWVQYSCRPAQDRVLRLAESAA